MSIPTIRAFISSAAFLWVFGHLFYNLSHFDQWLFMTGIADLRWWWPNEPIPQLVVASIGGVCCGWIVARLSRPSMVVMCVAFLLLWDFGSFSYAMNRFVSSRFDSSFRYELYLRYFLLWTMVDFVVIPLGMLLGGLLASTREGSESNRRAQAVT